MYIVKTIKIFREIPKIKFMCLALSPLATSDDKKNVYGFEPQRKKSC